MILDPYQEDPDYVQQVYNYDPSFGTIIRRHNVDDVYWDHHIFGENIGVAVIDNGIVDWAADLFFEVISQRYGQKSTVMTSNKVFSEWPAVFGGAGCVSAIVDRVVDPTTFAEWAEFDRYHREAFVERITEFVERVGS